MLDSATHVTIRSDGREIHFTYGMADIRESDELISKVAEFFCLVKTNLITLLEDDETCLCILCENAMSSANTG
jgi:hypothetical protein